MDLKTIAIALSTAALAALATGAVTQKDFDEMAAEVDRVRAAEVAVLDADRFVAEMPTEIAKALPASVKDPRLVKGGCSVVGGRVICQFDKGNEIQFPAKLTATLEPEVDKLKSDYDAEVAAKAAEEAAVEAARVAAIAAFKAAEEAALVEEQPKEIEKP